MTAGPVSPQEYGEGPSDDAALEADGYAAGLAVWGQVEKAYENYLYDAEDVGTACPGLSNSQLWSLSEAIRADERKRQLDRDRLADVLTRLDVRDRTAGPAARDDQR
jgi:hypothetical protein